MRIRVVALVLVAGVATACSSPSDDVPPVGPTAPTTRGAVTATPTPAAVLKPVPAWRPVDGEVHVRIKRAAVRFVEAAGTWGDAPGGTTSAQAGRVTALGVPRRVARTANRFAAPGRVASTVRITYPQMGGLTSSRASVMVVGVQTLLDGAGRRTTRPFTVDVRLDVEPDGSATVTGVEKAVPVPRGGGLSAVAKKVLHDDAVTLPAAAAADVRTGSLDDDLLRVLDGLAADHELSVLDLHTGHPHNVFETDRVSNHTQGRAVDIWKIDGTPVVEASHELLAEVMREAGALGATEVGGPFDYNGAGPGYFTDPVHLDHVHVGISPGRSALG